MSNCCRPSPSSPRPQCPCGPNGTDCTVGRSIVAKCSRRRLPAAVALTARVTARGAPARARVFSPPAQSPAQSPSAACQRSAPLTTFPRRPRRSPRAQKEAAGGEAARAVAKGTVLPPPIPLPPIALLRVLIREEEAALRHPREQRRRRSSMSCVYRSSRSCAS